MAEKPEDLNLPNSVVFRIIKESIPAGMNVSKDVRLAISKAASVFVLYCTATANAVAQASNRKTLSGTDVLTAMEEMEFEEFRPALQAFLQEYKANTASKKQRKTNSPGQKQTPKSSAASGSPAKGKGAGKKASPAKEAKQLTIVVDDSNESTIGESADEEEEEELEADRRGKAKGKLSREPSGASASRDARMDVDAEGDADSDDVVVLD